jgi:RNA polymerase sigma-70 factor (ECF subfamily)
MLGEMALREAHRILGPGPDAQDAAQEAIIRAYRARLRCRTPEAPHAWLRTIVRREALRLVARRPRVDLADPHEELAGGVADEGSRLANRLIARDALDRVAPPDRALLLRRYVLEQSSTEIAHDLALSPATVRVRLHRAIKVARQG